MKPVPPRIIQRLNLKTVVQSEYLATRNLLPPEPDWSQVSKYEDVLENVVRSRLGAGMDVRAMAMVSARKSKHGLRPVPLLGLPERVTYLALTQAATAGLVDLKRGPEDWLEFSQAPAKHGGSLAPKRSSRRGSKIIFGDLMPWASPIKYVVRSDVVAFYRHVDHRLLANQLIIRGADFEIVEHLIAFLGEIEGRPIGLPQLYEASDILSEVYVDAVERDMLRQGHAVWRFNDDFRIACKGYMDALKAIEDLDTCLRDMGLTLNEGKTSTPTFSNYYMEVMELEVGQSGGIVAKQEVEDVVGDYTDDFSQSADSASAFLERVKDARDVSGTEIDIKLAGQAEVRLARRALASLARHGDARGLDKVAMLVRYLAELTPTAIRYLIDLSDKGTPRSEVAKVLDELARKTATNDWQKLWLAYAYSATNVLTLKRGRPARLESLTNWQMRWSAPPLRAYAVWALASAGELSLKDVLLDQERAPESRHLFYAEAARLLGRPEDKTTRAKAFAADPLLQTLASV